MRQVIKLETLESLIDDQARENPSRRLDSRPLPARRSSLNLSKIKILASTAIPTDKIKPAIQAVVKVIGNNLKIIKTKPI